MNEVEDAEILLLRDQKVKEHPLLAAQNLLTGAGKPIMSPSQQRNALDLQRFGAKKALQCFTNEAFEFEKSREINSYKTINL